MIVRSLTAAACGLFLCSLAAAQTPARGFRLFGGLQSTDVQLRDTNNNVLHTWRGNLHPGTGAYLSPNGNLLRAVRPGEPGIGGSGGGLRERAFDGTLLWDFRYDGPDVLAHHDIHPMPNGNVLMMAWDIKTRQEAIDAGRDPALLTSAKFLPDHLIEVRRTGPTTGEIVWEWHLWDHVIQDFDATKANFGVVADHPELVDINYPAEVLTDGDWNHFNGLDYDPRRDLIIVSARSQDEIWIIDHSTTTAEAAGHTGGRLGKGGDLVYRWGNPEAFGAGTPADRQLFKQHDARFIEAGLPGAGHVMVFNNQLGVEGAMFSAVYELKLPIDDGGMFVIRPDGTYGPDQPDWSYTAPVATDFFSGFVSSAERLPNGNTLICSGWQGWVFEVTNAGQLVWEYFSTEPFPRIFHAHYVERTLWTASESFSTATANPVRLDFVGGSDLAGDIYLVLGSISGIDRGFTVHGTSVPLNIDPYLLYTLANVNTAPLLRSTGNLDASGRANATFALPPNILPPGLEMHHAFVVIDPITMRAKFASNPVRMEITP